MATERETKLTPEQQLARRTRRSFIGLGVGAVGVAAGWRWLNQPAADEEDIPPALRSALEVNQRVVRKAVYSNQHLAPTFPASAIRPLKKNGIYGIESELDPAEWRLEVVPMGAEDPAASLTLDDLRKLPRHEETIE